MEMFEVGAKPPDVFFGRSAVGGVPGDGTEHTGFHNGKRGPVQPAIGAVPTALAIFKAAGGFTGG